MKITKFDRNIKIRPYLMFSSFWQHNFHYLHNNLNFSNIFFFPRFWTKFVLPHPVCPKTGISKVDFASYEYFSISILGLKYTIELFELSLFLNFCYQRICCCHLDPKNNIWNFFIVFVDKDLTFHSTKKLLFPIVINYSFDWENIFQFFYLFVICIVWVYLKTGVL